jgi:hypothetical protein
VVSVELKSPKVGHDVTRHSPGLVFVADYHLDTHQADAMAQRIAAIDSVFSSKPRP